MSKRAARVGASALLREIHAIQMEEEEKARKDRVARIAKMASDVQAKVQGTHKEGRGSRSGRGLLDIFEALSDLRTDSSLIRGGNSTGDEPSPKIRYRSLQNLDFSCPYKERA